MKNKKLRQSGYRLSWRSLEAIRRDENARLGKPLARTARKELDTAEGSRVTGDTLGTCGDQAEEWLRHPLEKAECSSIPHNKWAFLTVTGQP